MLIMRLASVTAVMGTRITTPSGDVAVEDIAIVMAV